MFDDLYGEPVLMRKRNSSYKGKGLFDCSACDKNIPVGGKVYRYKSGFYCNKCRNSNPEKLVEIEKFWEESANKREMNKMTVHAFCAKHASGYFVAVLDYDDANEAGLDTSIEISTEDEISSQEGVLTKLREMTGVSDITLTKIELSRYDLVIRD